MCVFSSRSLARFFFSTLGSVVFHYYSILLLEHYQSPDPISCVHWIQYYHVTFVDLLELNSTVIIVSSCICVCVCGISKLEKMLIKIYHSFIHNVFVFDWLFSWSWSKISIDNWKQMFLVFLSNYFLSSIVYPSISHSRGISTNFKHNFRSCWHSFGSTSKIHCNEISRVASLIERKKKSIQPVDGSSNALNDFSRQKLNFSTFF